MILVGCCSEDVLEQSYKNISIHIYEYGWLSEAASPIHVHTECRLAGIFLGKTQPRQKIWDIFAPTYLVSQVRESSLTCMLYFLVLFGCFYLYVYQVLKLDIQV